MNVSNRGAGVSSGLGPFSAWIGTRYPRLNQITVGGSDGTRYLAESAHDPDAVAMTDVTGLDALALTPTGSSDLVSQLNAADKFPKWTLLAVISAVLLFVGIGNVADKSIADKLIMYALAASSVGLTIFMYRKESLEHLVPVEYTLEGSIPKWTAAMEHTWDSLEKLAGTWRIVESGEVETLYQRKTNAGASHLISRVNATFSTEIPRVLVANITVPSVKSGDTTLYFLPDRLLVRTGRQWTDVDYSQLRVSSQDQRFIEDGRPPRDARQVGTTWKFVNKGGGPDGRFKDNRQLPIMLYGRVVLSSPQGLSWILDLSVPSVAESLGSCLNHYPN
jgi:hypothetical protein